MGSLEGCCLKRTSVCLICCKSLMRRAGEVSVFSMRCIVDIVPATTRRGSTLRRSEGSLVVKVLRIRHLGWRVPQRVRTVAGRYRGPGALGSSGFANTDLDLQLKKHGIHQLIVMGLMAHTCC